MWFLKVLLHLACCKFSNTPISSFHAPTKHPIGCFVGADADSVQSWHSQRRLRANYPSLNKHFRLSHQYILLYAILVIARIHATLVASSLSASALGVLQVFQHANLVLPCSKKTPLLGVLLERIRIRCRADIVSVAFVLTIRRLPSICDCHINTSYYMLYWLLHEYTRH